MAQLFFRSFWVGASALALVASSPIERASAQDASEIDAERLRRCDSGEMTHCIGLAIKHQVEQNYEEATRLYRQACDGGDARGCTSLGYQYDNGHGVEQVDEVEAVRLYRLGCDSGDVAGCWKLGHMYEIGHGVVRSEEDAVRLYRQACDGGEMRGCVALNEETATSLLESCDGGGDAACTALGALYEAADKARRLGEEP